MQLACNCAKEDGSPPSEFFPCFQPHAAGLSPSAVKSEAAALSYIQTQLVWWVSPTRLAPVSVANPNGPALERNARAGVGERELEGEGRTGGEERGRKGHVPMSLFLVGGAMMGSFN